MKKVIWSLMAIVLLVIMVAGCAAPAPAPTPAPAPSPSPAPAPAPAPKPDAIVLKAVTIFPETHATARPLFMLRDRVNERANGELVIEYIGGPETIPMFEQGKSVSAGVVDMALVFSASYAGLVPEEGWITTSRLSYPIEWEVGFRDLLNEVHNKANLWLLGRGASGYADREPLKFHMWLNREIQTPYDLIGVKIGAVSPAMNAFLKALGATPVIMTGTDLYTALERGVVDGLWTGMSQFLGIGGLEVVDYYIDHRFGTDNMVFVINLDTWNRIPKHLQDLLIEVVKEIERDYPPMEIELIEDGWQKMKDAGIEFINFSPADGEWFTDLFYKVQLEKMRKVDPGNAQRAEDMLKQ